MARPSSDINPRKLNIRGEPLRRRKDRKKPEPEERLKDAEPEAIEKLRQLPLSPGVIAEWRKGHWQFESPHSDQTLWQVQLAAAFGTRSTSLLRVFIEQLYRIAPEDWDSDIGQWKGSETKFNALLALVAEQQPENSTQAALAAQMAATHLMIMRLMAQSHKYGHAYSSKDLALADRLQRTFTMQCETMQRLKGKAKTTEQSIAVTKETHQHVHYHDHRGGGENGNQSHGREGEAEASDISEAVWSDDESGDALSGTSREGVKSLPVSRGESRSAEG